MSAPHRLRRAGAAWAGIGLALTLGCAPAGEEGAAGADSAQGVASLAEVRALGLRNLAEPLPHVLTAAQISPEQMDRLGGMGYRSFVSLRPPDESGAGWEEAHATQRGVAFARVPVAGASGLTRENVEALDRILEEAGGEPTVVYCASSNRVGALLALRAYWLDGASPDDALRLGRSAGLAGLEAEVARLLSAPR